MIITKIIVTIMIKIIGLMTITVIIIIIIINI